MTWTLLRRVLEDRNPARVALLFFVGLALWFICRTSHVSIDGVRYFQLFDDAMVSMRYAANIVDHGVAEFNLGERIEGYTNPLWVALMALAYWVSGTIYAPLVIQLVGGICAGSAIYLYGRILGRDCPELRNLAVWLLVLCYPLLYFSVFGMENSLLALLVALQVAVLGRQSPYLQGALVSAAYLVRPDAILVSALIACLSLAEARRCARAMVPVAMVIVAVLGARYWYYGRFVPNTYVLKMGGGSLPWRLYNGSIFVLPFLATHAFVIYYALHLLLAKARTPAERKWSGLFGVGMAQVGYLIYVGGDGWQYWRHLSHVLPLLIVPALMGLRLKLRKQAAAVSRRKTVAIAMLSLSLLPNLKYLPEMVGARSVFLVAQQNRLIDYSVAINSLEPGADFSMLVFWAGVQGYLVRARVVDALGKVDAKISFSS